ncbi:MAG: hypothetical protein NVV59_02505 [Chitinophagaceae bacterium]|nr:hypothetical protein [Chitinophagaceae bacterium]
MTLLFKKFDLAVQVALILIAIIFKLSGLEWYYIYFTLGGWQIFSLLTHHVVLADFRSSSRRKAYAWSALTALLLTLIGAAASSIFVTILLLLVVFTPVLALWYLSICYLEIRALNLKNIVHMKR